MNMRIALAALVVLLGAVERAACQSGGFDTSSYPKPVPQPSFLNMLQQSNEIELQQLEIQRRQMQLNEQRYLQEQAQEREQREFEAQAAEQYRQRHAGDAAAAETWRKRHVGAPVQLAPKKPTKVSN
jgi:membrane protein involved in colicin uptake